MKEFKQQQDKSLDKIENFFTTAEEMKVTIDFFAQQYELLKTKYVKLESGRQRQEDQKYIKSLEERLDKSECYARATCLEIRNVPSSSPETKEMLVETIKNTGKVLSIPIQEHDVKDIYRIKTKDHNSKTIIVDFCSVLLKEKVIASYRKYN